MNWLEIMSDFTTALATLKASIERAGGRAFSRTETCPQLPASHPDYADNALQAAWNIADVLEQFSLWDTIRLGAWINQLKSFSQAWNPETGLLSVHDEKTLQLALALRTYCQYGISY